MFNAYLSPGNVNCWVLHVLSRLALTQAVFYTILSSFLPLLPGPHFIVYLLFDCPPQSQVIHLNEFYYYRTYIYLSYTASNSIHFFYIELYIQIFIVSHMNFKRYIRIFMRFATHVAQNVLKLLLQKMEFNLSYITVLSLPCLYIYI